MFATLLVYSLLVAIEPPAPSVEVLDYDAAVVRLRAVDEGANRDPAASIDALTDALAAFEAFAPELSRDPEALELREDARLNLARAHLMAGQRAAAEQVMDAAVRAAMGRQLPAESFGPSLSALYLQRVAALERGGYASLVVTCNQPCRIFIEQREFEEPPQLLLGRYTVWVEDVDGQYPPKPEQIEFTEAGEVHELVFPVVDIVPAAPHRTPQYGPDRIMPQWASVTLLMAGAAAMAVGGSIVTIAGTANDNAGLMAGAAVLGAGTAGLAIGVVVLTYDEYREARAVGRQATLSWTMRF